MILKNYFFILCAFILIGSNDIYAQGKIADEEIFIVAEEMPSPVGCENIKGQKQRQDCTSQKMTEFLIDHVTYPEEAKKNNIEGLVVIQFYVDKDGSISNINIQKEPGYGCGQAAIDAIEKMHTLNFKWNPGKQRGVPVKTRMTIPFQFELPKE